MIQTTLVVIVFDCVISYLQKRCFLFFKTVGFFIIIVCFSLFIECHRPQGAQIAAAHRCCQPLPAGRGVAPSPLAPHAHRGAAAARSPCPPRPLAGPTAPRNRDPSAEEPELGWSRRAEQPQPAEEGAKEQTVSPALYICYASVS